MYMLKASNAFNFFIDSFCRIFKNVNTKLKYGRVMQYSGVILHRYRYQPFEYSNALDVAYGNMKFLQ